MSRGAAEDSFAAPFLEASRCRACASPAHGTAKLGPRPSAVATLFRRSAAAQCDENKVLVRAADGISQRRPASLSDHVRRILVVLFADAFDQIGIGYQAPGQLD